MVVVRSSSSGWILVVVLLLMCSSRRFVPQVDAQGDALVQPSIIDSSNGLLSTTITIDYATISGGWWTFTNTRLLNGIMPGPTLRLSAGDTLRILFQNNLEQQTGTDFAENEYTKPDHSNLHFHGGHVSGELPSDDVRVPIAPGESYTYETVFPANHMAGTHWIHPHVHGSSTLQIGGGAAMSMIVRDEPGTLPADIEGAEDVLLFVQHMNINTLSNTITDHNDQKMSISSSGTPRNFFMINGQYQPDITMQPGEWQRWRVVMAGWLGNTLDFQVENDACEMQLLAKDGVYISDYPRTVTLLPLPPGGRADVMARCSTAGSYNVLDYNAATIMTITVTGTDLGSTALTAWAPNYPDYLTDLTTTAADTGCSCTTDISRCSGDNTRFCINDNLFDEHVYLHTVAFGSVVERELRGINNHPYHHHVYPYQIVSTGTIGTPEHSTFYQVGDWHDVIELDANTVTVRYRADVHTGVIMLHCHILTHEDKGTMSQELVIDGGACQCDALYTEPTSAPVAAPTAADPPSCFAPSATVVRVSDSGPREEQEGSVVVVPMEDLRVGDEVLTGSGGFQTVYAIDHFHRTKPTEFLRIHTTMEDEKPLEVTPLHMIYSNRDGRSSQPLPASLVEVGDFVQTIRKNGGSSSRSRTHQTEVHKVTKIETVVKNGFYNALTVDGTIVVDGVVCSTYPALSGTKYLEMGGYELMSHQDFVHKILIPIRAVHMFLLSSLPSWFRNRTDKVMNEESYFAWYDQVFNAGFSFFQVHQHNVVVQGVVPLVVAFVWGPVCLLSWILTNLPIVVLGVASAAVGTYLKKKRSNSVGWTKKTA